MTQPGQSPQQETWKESLRRAGEGDGVIPYLPEEVRHFGDEARAFQAGQRPAAAFQGFRLKQGVYGQRQPNRQMLRVKVPGGMLTAAALEALADTAERYALLKRAHVTTRGNLELHNVPLDKAAEVMDAIGKVGLTTREACGSVVRNVVLCPLSGVCDDEVFDPAPYMAAYARYFVRHPLTQALPRKWKTAFCGCGRHDCVVAPLHDLAFLARVKTVDGKEVRGFKVYAGGGTSIMPRLGQVLYEFAPAEEMLRVSLAVITVFSKRDELRKNRMMARIKVLIDRVGFDTFREMVDAELQNTPPVEIKPEWMQLPDALTERPPSPGQARPVSHHLPREFVEWRDCNTLVQRQQGYCAVWVKLPQGDVQAAQLRALAGIVRKHTGGVARATQEQNIALRWVPETALVDVWRALSAAALAETRPNTIVDVVACPGTDTCKSAITSTTGLARAIEAELRAASDLVDDPMVEALHIKLGGCPNGCGQHHIANIGLHGAVIRGEGGQQAPAYDIFLGGNYGVGEVRYGTRLAGARVPARRAPEVIKRFLRLYVEGRKDGESFNAFVDRVGAAPFEAVASEYRTVGPLGKETMELYMDCGKTALWKLERGEGECAA